MRGDFTPFISKSFQIWDHFFPLLFPNNSKSLKNVGHPTSRSGGKETFKRYLKSEQTHRHTYTHTHIWTNRLIESNRPRGPMLWKLCRFNKPWVFFILFFFSSLPLSSHNGYFLSRKIFYILFFYILLYINSRYYNGNIIVTGIHCLDQLTLLLWEGPADILEYANFWTKGSKLS